MTIRQNLADASSNPEGQVGISLTYADESIITNVDIDDFFNGIYMQRSPDSILSHVYCQALSSPNRSFIGFNIDGGSEVFSTTLASPASAGTTILQLTNLGSGIEGITSGDSLTLDVQLGNNELVTVLSTDDSTSSVTLDSPVQLSHNMGAIVVRPAGGPNDDSGNASTTFRDCVAINSAGTENNVSIGFNIFALSPGVGYCGDLEFDIPQTAGTAYGMAFDFSNTQTYSDASGDIQIFIPTLDQWSIHGILIRGLGDLDSSSCVTIHGGWINANASLASAGGASTFEAIYLDSTTGVSITGTQFFPPQRTLSDGSALGIYAINCSNSTISNCSFNSQDIAIQFNQCLGMVINANTFFGYQSPRGIGRAMNPAIDIANSTGIVINGNTFNTPSARDMPLAISIPTGSAECVVSGNSVISYVGAAYAIASGTAVIGSNYP